MSLEGNAAGMGAKLALISRSKRAEAQALARRIGYVELATDSQFARTLAQAMYLVHFHKTDLDFWAASARALVQARSRRSLASATR